MEHFTLKQYLKACPPSRKYTIVAHDGKALSLNEVEPYLHNEVIRIADEGHNNMTVYLAAY